MEKQIGNIKIKDAAKMLNKNEMFVRIGLQRGLLPFGTAIKMESSSRYSYHISPKLFEEYLGTSRLHEEK